MKKSDTFGQTFGPGENYGQVAERAIAAAKAVKLELVASDASKITSEQNDIIKYGAEAAMTF